MSNPGEWIDFAELCKRLPHIKPRQLRTLYKDRRVISYRQLVTGGKVEFNWKTVQRELRAAELTGTHAQEAAMLDDPEKVVPMPAGAEAELRAEVAGMRRIVEAMARQMGISAEVFAGEQGRRAG